MRSVAAIVVAAFSLATSSALALPIDEKLELLPGDGAAGDQFGHSVAVNDSTALVAALYDDDKGTSSGSAYLFDPTTGQQLAKLVPNDGAAFDLFGTSVALSSTFALIGSKQDDDLGNSSGSAYLFDAATGQQVDKLLPNDGAANDLFGSSVAISGNLAVVGSPNDEIGGFHKGSVYLFDTTTGQQLDKFLASDGDSGDQFGFSVAISGSIVVVGAPYKDHDDDDCLGSKNHGTAYVFDATTGQQIAQLFPSECANGDEFGFSVAVSGTTAVVGAHYDEWDDDEDDSADNKGSAYVFDTTSGQQIAQLRASDGASRDEFGYSVAIRGTTAVVGSPFHDDQGTSSGSVYLFDATTGQQIDKLGASDGAAHDNLGESVAIAGATVVAGAVGSDDVATDAGSAYVFSSCHVEFVPFGSGLAGSGGFVPTLNGVGDSCDKNGRVIEMRDALGGTAGLLWVGLGQSDIPFFGGRFYVDFSSWWVAIPVVLQGPLNVAGAGWLDLPGSDLHGLEGLSLYLQATLADSGAVRGVSLTNALAVHIRN